MALKLKESQKCKKFLTLNFFFELFNWLPQVTPFPFT